jgi:hypothetical protein
MILGHGPIKRQNPLVRRIIYFAAEFNRDGAVATREDAGSR